MWVSDGLSAMRGYVRDRAPGTMLAALLGAVALVLSTRYGAPVMLLALLLGMALNFLSQVAGCRPGIEFGARQLLRWGVALLGLKITLSQIQSLGWQPVAMVVIVVVTTLAFGLMMARWMGFRPFFGLLSGGAVGICGASAALALSAAFPPDPRRERATSFAVIGVSTLSTAAMVLYPLLAQMFNLDAIDAGVFLGGTIHDVAQVVGAGYSLSPETGDVATVVKLMRVSMLVPVVAFAAWMAQRQRSKEAGLAAKPISGMGPTLLPGFAVGFLLLVLVNSLGVIPPSVSAVGGQFSQFFLVTAMVAIGMKTQLKDILTVGWRPVVLLLMETLFLAFMVLTFLWGQAHWS